MSTSLPGRCEVLVSTQQGPVPLCRRQLSTPNAVVTASCLYLVLTLGLGYKTLHARLTECPLSALDTQLTEEAVV